MPSHEHVVQIVQSARRSLGMTQVELCEVTGMSLKTLVNLEHGDPSSSMAQRLLEYALGWEAGSYRQILDGGKPTPTTLDLAEVPSEALLAEIARRLP